MSTYIYVYINHIEPQIYSNSNRYLAGFLAPTQNISVHLPALQNLQELVGIKEIVTSSSLTTIIIIQKYREIILNVF